MRPHWQKFYLMLDIELECLENGILEQNLVIILWTKGLKHILVFHLVLIWAVLIHQEQIIHHVLPANLIIQAEMIHFQYAIQTLHFLYFQIGQLYISLQSWSSFQKCMLILQMNLYHRGDNGPWEMKCDLAGSCGPFAGKWQRDEKGGGGGSAKKSTIWECGHRVPSLVLWPGHVKPGSVSDALVSSLDIIPTIAAILNISLPSDRYYDGMNIQDILTGQSNVGHEVLFHPNSGSAGPDGEIGAVRIGDYKVVYYTGGFPDCDYNTGPVMSHSSFPLVFNIKNDPEEGSPLEVNTPEWLSAVQAAEEALAWLEISLQQDNTNTVNYTTDSSARPCCNTESSICQCPWD